jgi:hypothetical protein
MKKKINGQKVRWGSWLKPHVAPAPKPPVERVVGQVFIPPADWPSEKRTLFSRIEEILYYDKRFRHLSVLPPGCTYDLIQTTPT